MHYPQIQPFRSRSPTVLQRFAPILYPNEIHNDPEEGAGVPVGVSWLLRNSRVLRISNGTQVLLDRPTIASAVTLVDSLSGAKDCFISNYYLWGDAPGEDRRSWPISIALGEGIYGRVWKPWRLTHPYICAVQYFVFLTWNETAYNSGDGNHEGDWLCVDFAVDTRCGYENPPVIHAIYHNHGGKRPPCRLRREGDK